MVVLFLFFLFPSITQAATPVYYSVGQNADDHKTGTPTITISSGTATFSTAQTASNMGVGDRVSYGSSSATSTAYISEKVSTTQWKLVNNLGVSISNISVATTVLAIAHEYTSLSAAEAGASDSSHIGTSSLVYADVQLNIPCYYDSGADTNAVTVSGWETSSTTYIKIYTPNNILTEVNLSQRHSGVWGDEKYNLNTTDTSIDVNDDYVEIYGLQLFPHNNSWRAGIAAGGGDFTTIAYSIAKNDGSTYSEGFNITDDSIIYNSIAYGFNGEGSTGFRSSSAVSDSINVYNCTAYNNNIGFRTAYGDTNYYNCVSFSNDDDFQIGGTTVANCASDDGDGDNAIQPTDWSSVFVDYNNYNFILKSTDTDLKDAGTSTPVIASLGEAISDIQGTPRGASWDIGADEVPVDFVSTICENTSAGGDCANLDYNTLSTWEDAVETDLTATSTKVYGGSITGSLDENDSLDVYIDGSDTSINVTVVATTSDQILVDGITGTSTYLTLASGTQFRLSGATTNRWTVSGTGDNLGASPRAVAKIDGTWSGAETGTGNSIIWINDTWTTDIDNSIKIYTVNSARHNGKWSTSAYRFVGTSSGGYQDQVNISDVDYVTIDGLQFEMVNSGGYTNPHSLAISSTGYNVDSKYIISNNIFRDQNFTTSAGLAMGYNSSVNVYVFNNIFYGLGAYAIGADSDTDDEVYVSNNTIYNCNQAIRTSTNNVTAKNNLIASTTNPYTGTFNSASDYNATDISDTPDGGGSHNLINQTINFVDAANNDFHLTENNPTLIDAGADISSETIGALMNADCRELNSPRTDSGGCDIDGTFRFASSSQELAGFDIGADEVNERTATSTGRWTATSTWSGGYIPRSWETITIPAGIDVTYDPGNIFQDDFEENAFSDWTGHSEETGNTNEISSSYSYAGDYSTKFVFDGTSGSNENYRYKTLSASQFDFYFRTNIYIDSESLTDTNETNLVEFANVTPEQSGGISLYKNGSDIELKSYYHSGTTLTALGTNYQIATGTWYTLEYYQKANDGSGEASFWVNGTKIASTTGLSNVSYPTRRIYAGQLSGTNDEAITFYLDDIAADSEHRVGYRPVATSTAKPTAIDYNINDITIADTGSLITGSVIDADYSYRYPLWVYGDVNVNGTLDQNAKSEIKIKNDTTVEHGIIVSSTGMLDVDGTSKLEQDAVIGSVIEDSNHNGYVYCGSHSECYIKNVNISYMGSSINSSHYGISTYYSDSSNSNEAFVIENSKIHNGYIGIDLEGGGNHLIKNNDIYSNSYKGISDHWGSSYNLIIGNKIFNNGHTGIVVGDNWVFKNNILFNNDGYAEIQSGADDAYIYNNIAVNPSSSHTFWVNSSSNENNTFKNNISAYGTDGFYDFGTNTTIDNNLFYGNDSNSATGTNAIESDPLFYNFDNSPSGNDTGGTARSVSSATSNTLTASSPSWNTDEWKGYTIWADDDFSSASGAQFRYILSNTTDTLTIAGTWDSTPTASYEFKIIDFTLSANSPALGSGTTTISGGTDGITNIGAITDYVRGVTDSDKEYNSMQLAHDNDSTGAGDTITTYTNNLLSDAIDGSIGITDIGNGFYSFAIDEDITQNDGYNGYYLYIEAGADRGKYYLITDTASTTDTLYIFDSEQSAELNDNDEFVIIDRVYARQGERINEHRYNLYFTKDGTPSNPLIWNVSGNVILDAEEIRDEVIILHYADYNTLDGFIVRGANYNGVYLDLSSDFNTLKNMSVTHNANISVPFIGGIKIDGGSDYNLLENNEIFNNEHRYGFVLWGSGVENNVLKNNKAFDTPSAGFEIRGGTNVFLDNISFGHSADWASGFYFDSNTSNTTIKNNVAFKNYSHGIYIESDGTEIENNVALFSISVSSGDSIAVDTGVSSTSVIRNNIIGGSLDGIDSDSTEVTHDFNYFYNNAEDIDGGGSIGTSSITGTDPNFKSVETGSADTNSASTTIIDAGQNWTANKWVGYGLKITISGTEYWAGITSNTSDRLYLAPDLDATPTNGDSFVITDFSITGTTTSATTPLGSGARADGSTSPGTVNMGAITDFSKNITDNTIFNSMQDAHDDAGLGAGDTVTTYAVNEYENGTTGTSTDLGPMIEIEVNEDAITEDNQYEGMYLYIEAGENRGRHYLIVDSQEDTQDTITLLEDSTDGFNEGDIFTIVDRVYDDMRENNVLLNIHKGGTAESPIEWNTDGKVILDAQGADNSLIYINGGDDYQIINGFTIRNTTDRSIFSYADYCVYKNNEFYDIDNDAFAMDPYSLIENNYLSRVHSVGSIDDYSVAKNNIVNTTYSGIETEGSSYSLIFDNSVFGITNYDGIRIDHAYVTVKDNKVFANHYRGIWFYSNYADNAILENNIIVGQDYSGITINSSGRDNNSIKNNIIAYNGDYGLEDTNNPNTNTNDFNYYYNNNSGDYSGTQSIGTHSITGTAPGFLELVSSTIDANSTTTVLIDSSQSWTTNQWVGYGLKINISGTDYWAGITSNSESRLFLAPPLDVLPSSGDSYIITDFSIASTSAIITPLGQGCSADGTTEPGTVNMGAHTGYTYNANINSGTKYNSMQAAHDDPSLASGDDVLVYAVDEITLGTIASSTDLGPMVQLGVDEASVTSDNDYAGMYLYILSGTNQYKHYLIARTDENTNDSITIVTDDNADSFMDPGNRWFQVVDRVYNELADPTTPSTSANLALTKSGDNLGDRIQFSSNGTVILDANPSVIARSGATWQSLDHNIADTNGLKFVKLNNFQLSNSLVSNLSGDAIFQTEGAGYQTDYCWPNCADTATEFVATVDPGNNTGADFSSLASWEASLEVDLTDVATMVYSYSTSTGIMPLHSTVIGQTSGAMASTTVSATSSKQILFYNITPNGTSTFESGELVYVKGQATSTANVVLADNGNMAIAVAECQNSTGVADTAAVTIDGWTTNASNYIKIWTNPDDVYRHHGVWDDNKYRLENTSNIVNEVIYNHEDYIKISGLQIYAQREDYGKSAISSDISNSGNIYLSNNILRGYFFGNDPGINTPAISIENNYTTNANYYIWNNIIYGWNNANSKFSAINFIYPDNSFVYNNTIFDCSYGFTGGNSDDLIQNNIVQNTSISYSGTFNSSSSNNISSDSTAPGTDSITNATVQFVNSAGNDFRLATTDTVARDAGTSTPVIASLSEAISDIQGTPRGASWDIGADEVPVDFVSTICENTSAGGDCANLDYNTLSTWESAVDSDLTATSTKVYGGSITGTLNAGNTLTLYESGTTTGIIATLVATTSDQILLINIPKTSDVFNDIGCLPGQCTASGSMWVLNEGVNYWTVSGTGDDLGASPRAVAKIDGEWSGADGSDFNIDGWSTDIDNSIKIYTTNTARHNGAWNDNKYRIVADDYYGVIRPRESYVVIDGLQVKNTRSDATGIKAGINYQFVTDNTGIFTLSNSIITATGDGVTDNSDNYESDYLEYNFYNNIVYNIGGDAFHLTSKGRTFLLNFYNNTVYNSGDDGFFVSVYYDETVNIKNNIIQNSNGADYSIESDVEYFDYSNNISSDNSALGSNSFASTTVDFVSTSTYDFHLVSSDTGAKGAGVNILDSGLGSGMTGVENDIDGSARPNAGSALAWDIGADQTARKIYRSVGPSNISTLADYAGEGTLTLSSTTATFASALPDNIGVGDVIQYDTDNAGGVDTLAFIHGRTDSTHYTVRTVSGEYLTIASTTITTWEIYRAYTSLYNAEEGTENTGLDDTLENFDTWTDGKDIVTSNEQWNIAAYGDAVDTTAVEISGWETGVQNYIKIYTPVESNEVGVSQRHNGVWDDGKYLLKIDSSNAINMLETNVRVDGLQLYQTNSIAGGRTVIRNSHWNGTSWDEYKINFYISNNIIKASPGTGVSGKSGISFSNAKSGSTVKIFNNIIYNGILHAASSDIGIGIQDPDIFAYTYNNMIDGFGYGIYINAQTDGEMVVKNNIVQGCLDGYYGTFDVSSDYNISDIASDAPNATFSTAAITVRFADEANNDFHLSPLDRTAKNAGTSTAEIAASLSLLAMTEDIDGQTRNADGQGYDIGADEAANAVFYSVGQVSTDHQTSTSTVSISNGLATFSVAQTSNVFGVGDRITYDTDKIVYVSEKQDASNWYVVTATGTTPADITNSLVVSIIHEYTSLSNAEAGAVDSNHLNNTDLKTNNLQLNFPCYYDNGADTNGVEVSGYITAQPNYIKIYTPNNIDDECNLSQRHSGAWNDNKYSIIREWSVWADLLYISDHYVNVDGLQIKLTGIVSTEQGGTTLIGKSGSDNGGLSIISNNILYNNALKEVDVNIIGINTTWPINSFNNIIINVDRGIGCYSWYGASSKLYNNTIYNSGVGIYQTGDYSISSINNIIQNCTTGYSIGGSLTADSDYNITSDNTAPGIHSITNATVKFLDEKNNDFRLSPKDIVANDAGIDLSTSTAYVFDEDIVGHTRGTDGAWDIGASEAATEIFRSVGPGNITALETGASTTLSISGSTATFSNSMPLNMGVGDVIQYDSNNNGTVDALAFIHGRTTDKIYTVKTATGSPPTATTAGDNDWSVFRAYTSLSLAEEGSLNGGENDGLDDSLEDFESWEMGKDIFSSNEQWNIVAYADAIDTNSFNISHWETAPQNYLKIYTPYQENEVGISQRHSGIWNENKFYFNGGIINYAKNVQIDGLQFHKDSGEYFRILTDGEIEISFSNNIMKGNNDDWARLVNDTSSVNTGGVVKIFNNIAFDHSDPDDNPIYCFNGGVANYFVYNNTCYNVDSCFNRHSNSGSTVTLINNLVSSSTNGYIGTFHADSDYNISDLAADAPGAHSKNSTIVAFRDIANNDFRLDSYDTSARNAGVNLQADSHLWFEYDIEGDVRDGNWDIGADEVVVFTIMPTAKTENYNKTFGLDEGLVGYWTFDGPDINWDTNTILDRSGNYNNGIASGSPKAVNGKHGQAFEFDGVDDYVEMDNNQALDNELTISAWTYMTETGLPFQEFIKQGNRFGLDTSVGYRFFVDGGDIVSVSSGSLILNEWVYVVGTYNAGVYSLYINGVFSSSTTTSNNIIDSYSDKIRLGVHTPGSDTSYLKGSLDEVRIYNRALSATEVGLLYRKDITIYQSTEHIFHKKGLVGYWSFDGPNMDWSSTTAEVLDTSGYANPGNLLGGYKAVRGKLGQGMKFNGSDSYVDIGTPSELDISGEITVMAWVRADSDTDGRIVSKHAGGSYGWSLLRHDGDDGLSWRISSDGSDWISGYSSFNIFEVGEWYHVVGVYDGSYMRIYVNGDEDTGNSYPYAYSSGINVSTGSVQIGRDDYMGDSHIFDGTIDEVRIYNYALSAREIKSLYQSGRIMVIP